MRSVGIDGVRQTVWRHKYVKAPVCLSLHRRVFAVAFSSSSPSSSSFLFSQSARLFRAPPPSPVLAPQPAWLLHGNDKKSPLHYRWKLRAVKRSIRKSIHSADDVIDHVTKQCFRCAPLHFLPNSLKRLKRTVQSLE